MISLAQTVPIQILEQIIAYGSGIVPVSGHRTAIAPRKLKKPFFPFLSICREWRSVAVMMMYQEVGLAINSECDGIYKAILDIPSMVDTARLGTEALVKAVHIRVPFIGLINGKVPSLLLSGPLKDITFANTNELIIVLGNCPTTTCRLPSAEVDINIRGFAALVSRMFPKVHNIFVCAEMPSWMEHRGKIADIVNLIASGKQGVALQDSSYGNRSLGMPNIINLKRILLKVDKLGGTLLEIVCRSRASLTEIRLYEATPQDIHDIVCDSSGNLIEYPAVFKLDFTMKVGLMFRRCDPPVGNAFPNLTHFSCEDAYPFTSLSFLENCKFLEKLCMHVDENIKEMFKESGWLDRNHFPQLHSVHLVPDFINRHNEVSSTLTLPEIALKLSPNIERVAVDSQWKHSVPDTMRILKEHAHLSSIRVLDLPCTLFTYEHTSRIICLFPHLVRCSLRLTNEVPGSRSQLSAHIIKQQQQSVGAQTCKSKLLLLRICGVENLDELQLLARAFLLAVLTPSIKRIELPRHNRRPPFEQLVSKIKGRKAFKAHADRLSRLQTNPII